MADSMRPVSGTGQAGFVGAKAAPEKIISSTLADAVLAAGNQATPAGQQALRSAFENLSRQLEEVGTGLRQGTIKPEVGAEIIASINDAAERLGQRGIGLPGFVLTAVQGLSSTRAGSGNVQPRAEGGGWAARALKPEQRAQEQQPKRGRLGADELLGRIDSGAPGVVEMRSSGMSVKEQAIVREATSSKATAPAAKAATGDLATLEQLVAQYNAGKVQGPAMQRRFFADLAAELGALKSQLEAQPPARADAKEMAFRIRDMGLADVATVSSVTAPAELLSRFDDVINALVKATAR